MATTYAQALAEQKKRAVPGTYASVAQGAAAAAPAAVATPQPVAVRTPAKTYADVIKSPSATSGGSGAAGTGWSGLAQTYSDVVKGAGKTEPVTTYAQAARENAKRATYENQQRPVVNAPAAEQANGGLPAGVTMTTYIDASGQPQTGYIIAGKTYADPEGQNRVGVGSKVTQGGQTWILTDQGAEGISSEEYQRLYGNLDPSMITDSGTLDSLIAEISSARNQAVASNDAAYAAQLEQTLNQLNAQKEALNRQYGATNQQLYKDTMMQQKNLPQQLAALGYTGGLTESSMLDLATTYSEALRANEQARAQGLTDIDLGMSDARLETEIARLQANADAENNYVSNYSQAVQAIQSQKNWEAEHQAQQEAESREYLNNVGQSFLQAGIIPDDTILAAMGITPEAAAAYVGLVNGGSSGSVGGYQRAAAVEEPAAAEEETANAGFKQYLDSTIQAVRSGYSSAAIESALNEDIASGVISEADKKRVSAAINAEKTRLIRRK